MRDTMKHYRCDHLWTPNGYLDDAVISVDGTAYAVADATSEATTEQLGRFVLPGVVNAHSHAFQRAMAGLAERQTHANDSFWTWRELMYRFAGLIGPDDLHAIAAQLYVEMLEAGYTSVCEFHYLHHQPDGQPYANPAELSLALMAAARETGIGMTLLPVLYVCGGFDGRALTARQQRFGHRVDEFLTLLSNLRTHENSALTVGIALHSLRAVPESAMTEVLAAERGHARPIHIHIAEQMPEVEECLAVRGMRPVTWLHEHAEVDQRWTLVHATHLDDREVAMIAASNATVAICPTTEANLGDGLFPLKAYLDAGGSMSIGSDSHVSISPVEELRWLEYGQRLRAQRRNIAISSKQPSVGAHLFAEVVRGGQASRGAVMATSSAPADFVVLDDQHPLLAARDADQLLDTWIFSGNRPLVRDVMAGGVWVVRDGRHPLRERIAERYGNTLRRLRSKL